MHLLKQFQEAAVASLLQHNYAALRDPQIQTPVLLEAPTGAGKTVMMAAYLERLVDGLPLQPGLHNNVAFIWFAPNTLHLQSFRSLQALYADESKLTCIELTSLPNNPQLNPKELLFVNWSSVDSLTKIWRRDNETSTNLETLVENTTLTGTQIILIIDEAHLSAFTGPQAVAVRNLIGAKIEVLVTATPRVRPQRAVFISRQEVVAEGMIKKGVRLNIGLDPEQQAGDNVHIHLLRTAFTKKQELQRLYDEELGEGVINPLLLIQLPSENATLSEEDKSIRAALEGLLTAEHDISTQNGRLAVWVSGERATDGLEAQNGLQDVLIFKQAIAQGWDCPRAAVLVSYRAVQNVGFGIQTVGRILRMPHQRHYGHDALNYGYVYTNIQSNRINLVPQDADYFSLQIARRREGVYPTLKTAAIVNDRPSKGVLTTAFETRFFSVMEQRYGISQLPDIDLFTPAEEAEMQTQKAANRLALQQQGWTFAIDDNQIALPTDIDLDPYEVTAIVLNNTQMRRFAVTNAEFAVALDRFCYDSITRLNRSKSWKKLRETLINFAEYYLGLFEVEARRFYLYPQNQHFLSQHIAQALENFEAWQTAQGNLNRRVEWADWQVPVERAYSEQYREIAAANHALQPFLESNTASGPEKSFRDVLASSQGISWWYKNGDSGSEHFAVSYTNSQGELRLFYPDFIIQFASGIVGVFDTKTKRSDTEAPSKHEGLIAYMERENALQAGRRFVGGILIPEEVAGVLQFRYCTNRITDTNDLTGWEYFSPATIAL